MMPILSRCRAFGLFFLCVLIGSSLQVQAQSSRTITKEVELDPDGEVELSLQAGDVKVTGWDQSTVRVSVKITGKSAKTIEDATLHMDGDSRQVTINTEVRGQESGGFLALLGFGGPSGPETHYTLQMPAPARFSVSMESASVDVRGLNGGLNVEGASGSVRLRNVGGTVNVATFSGSLDADSVQGPINFATFSGTATVRSQRPPKALRLASFSGNAEIILPSDAAFDLRTDTGWGGSVTSDFALPDSTSGSDGSVSIGGGGPAIEFESFSGSLRLREGK